MFIAKNLRRLRLEKGWTQEEVAERIQVTGQAVSKWERDESCPDIALLPGRANLFGVTVDEVIGMEEISGRGRLGEIYAEANRCQLRGDYAAAAEILAEARKTFPGDAGLRATPHNKGAVPAREIFASYKEP